MKVMAKFTVWRFYEVPEGNEEVVLEKLRQKEHPDYIQELCDNYGDVSTELIEETEALMDIEENNGMSTIEVFDNECEKIWENGWNGCDTENKPAEKEEKQ